MSPAKSAPSLPSAANASVLEAAYEAWQQNPDSVDPTWRAFFQGFTLGTSGATPAALASGEGPAAAAVPIIDSLKQSRVHHLIASGKNGDDWLAPDLDASDSYRGQHAGIPARQ